MSKNREVKVNKKITYIILILMICNFILPNYSYALSNTDGGSLLGIFAKFLCFIPDTVLNVCQEMFVSPENIKQSRKQYQILYSPAIIFSGTQVPAFDINFINPEEDKYGKVTKKDVQIGQGFDIEDMASEAAGVLAGKDAKIGSDIKEEIDFLCDNIDFKINGGKTDTVLKTPKGKELSIVYTSGYIEHTLKINKEIIIVQASFNELNYSIYCSKNGEQILERFDELNPNILVEYLRDELYREFGQTSSYDSIKSQIEAKANAMNIENAADNPIWSGKFEVEGTVVELEYYPSETEKGPWICIADNITYSKNIYTSSAGVLQHVISTWYKALRRIALVGLLSVLVYIGIQIVLTSTAAGDNAKYKKMLKDWLVAICLLFTLHYIMNFTITIVNRISSILTVNVIGEDGEDILLTSIRNTIASGNSWAQVITEVIIYDVIVIYTVMFTIQYIRRVIHLGFLTAIAPLITLTYPLDKIKDSKAQAFEFWIKDYLFFSLIQIVHLLIYYVLVASSIDLTDSGNWIYALVAVGFLTIAEKLIKNMFGFNKSKSINTLNAGLTGALVMDAMNSISNTGVVNKVTNEANAGSAGNASNSETNSQTVRTTKGNPLQALQTDGSLDSLLGTNPNMQDPGNDTGTGSPKGNINNALLNGGESEDEDSGRPTNKSTNTPRNNNRKTKTQAELQQEQRIRKTQNRNIWAGVTAVGKKHVLPGGKKIIREGAGVVLGATGVLLGGTGAIIKASSGKNDKETLTKAVLDVTVGLKAGLNVGRGAVDAVGKVASGITKIPKKAQEVADTYVAGADGQEVADNRKFDREFKKTNDYKQLKANNNNFSENAVNKMLDAGITDVQKMDKILKKAEEHPRKFSIDNGITYTYLAEKCSEDILYNRNHFIQYFQNRHIDLKPEDVDEMRKNIIEFK